MNNLVVIVTGGSLAADLADYLCVYLKSAGISYRKKTEKFPEQHRIALTIHSKFAATGKNRVKPGGEKAASLRREIPEAPELKVHCTCLRAKEHAWRDEYSGKCPDYLFVEIPKTTAGTFELELERFLKGVGVRKVLFLSSEEDKARAFEKISDRVLCELFNWLGVLIMPEDIPDELIDRIKEEAVDGKLTCTRAHELAKELGLAVRVVGRACDILGIKIIECELGCF